MVRIAIEEVQTLRDRQAEINRLPMDQIEWTRNGELVPVTPEQRKAFRFTGLNNICFVDLEFWRGAADPDEPAPVPESDPAMAALRLHSHLHRDPDVWSIGFSVGPRPGNPRLIIYRSSPSATMPTLWEGYPVEVTVSDRPVAF